MDAYAYTYIYVIGIQRCTLCIDVQHVMRALVQHPIHAFKRAGGDFKKLS